MFFMTIPQVKELYGVLTAIKKAQVGRANNNVVPAILEVEGGSIRISALLGPGVAEYWIFCPAANFPSMQITDMSEPLNGLKTALDIAKVGGGNALACEKVDEGLKLSVCGAEIVLPGRFETASGGNVYGAYMDIGKEYVLGNRCILQGDVLKGILANLIPFMSREDNRASYKGLTLTFKEDGTIEAVATDTYRLAHQELGKSIGDFTPKNVLIPDKIVDLMNAFLGKDGKGAIVQVKHYTHHVEDGPDEYYVLLQNGKWTLRTGTLHQGTFPNYEILDWTTPAVAHVRYADGKTLDKTLMVLAKAADARHRTIKLEIGKHETTFTIDKFGATIMTQRVSHELLGDEDGGNGEPVKLMLNAEYLRDVIAKQPCEVKYRSEHMPVIFERPGLSAMIMPIR